MGFTIKQTFLVVSLLVSLNVYIDANFTEFELFVLSRSIDYQNAVDLCRKYDMNLVKIEDEISNKMVFQFAFKRNLGEYWIDGKRGPGGMHWVYNDGSEMAYTKWHPGQPDNCNNENCVHGLFFPNGFWNDINCNKTIAAICYVEKSVVDIIKIDENQLVVLGQKVNYQTAVKLCKQHELNLIKIQNEETNQVVYNYAVQREIGEYWIDANDNSTEGLFVYSDGNRILYNKWYPGEPNNNRIENCVHGLFYKNGFWNDIACNRTIKAICYGERSTEEIIKIEERQLVALGQKADFNTAVNLCRQHGMNLIKIQNEETNELVYNFAVQRGIGEYWIDANDITTEGLWVYSDGNRIVYNKWYRGEPNNLGIENCVQGLFYKNGFWNDIACNVSITTICYGEISIVDTIRIEESQMVALGQKADYKTAVELCKQYGMNLIKVQNDITNEAVQKFAEQRGLGEYWIDANDMTTEGLWVYSDGYRIVYNKWQQDQPDNCNNEDCVQGYFHNNGLWNDISCNRTITIICYGEKSTTDIIKIEESQLVTLGLKVDYKTAVSLCKKRGMNLIKIQNNETNEVIYNYAVQKGLGQYWIDANDITTEGLWVYSDGNRIVFNNWERGEPNNQNNENCAQGLFYKNGLWNDIACNKTITAICYNNPPPPVKTKTLNVTEQKGLKMSIA